MGDTVTAPAGPASSVQGAGWLGAGAMVVKMSQTAVLLLLAALLAPEAIGVLSIGALVLNVTSAFTDLGTSTALVYWKGDAHRAARSALTLALGLAIAVTATLWVAAPTLSATLNAGDLGVRVIRGMVLCLPFLAVAGVAQELLRRALAFRRRVVPDMVGALAGASLTVGLALNGQGAMSLVYGQLLQSALTMALLWRMHPVVVPGWSTRDVRALLSYGGSLAGGSILTLLMLNVDYIVVAHQLGAHEVGVYSMAFRLAYMPYLLLAVVIGGAVFAHLCRLQGPAVGATATEAAVVLHAMVVPLYVGVLLLAPQLELLGHQWESGVAALRWLAAYGLVLSSLELVMVALKAAGHTRDTFVLTGVHLVVLVALLLAVVDRGVTFAAVAQLAAGVLTLVAAVVVVRRRVEGIDWAGLLRGLVPVAAGAATMTVAVLLIELLVLGDQVSFLALVALGSSGAVAYVVPVLLLDRQGRTGVAAILRRATLIVRSAHSAVDRLPLSSRTTAAGLALCALVLLAGIAAVVSPSLALLGAVAATTVALMVLRLEWALLAYVAVEPFGDLVATLHPAAVKATGALLFGAWALRRLLDDRPLDLRRPGVVAAGVLALLVVASMVAAGATGAGAGAAPAIRYLSYIGVLVVLVDTLVAAGPSRAALVRRIAAAYVLSCTAAAVVGLAGFLAHGGRAGGPLEDPNDFAFFLVTAWPAALWLARTSGRLGRSYGVASVVLVVGACATLSRGALLALAVMGVVALVVGLLRARVLLAGALVTGLVLAVAWVAFPDIVNQSLAEKDHVASANVESRFTTWAMAADMTAERPLLGQGPGGFGTEAPRFVPAGAVNVTESVAHQMYLDVAAELGLLGLGAFLLVILHGLLGAVRARRSAVPGEREAADVVLVALTGALVGACFLSEQYYLPVWLLAGIGIALEPWPSRTPAGSSLVLLHPREGGDPA